MVHASPDAVIGWPVLPLNSQIAIIELSHLRREPAARVNAVGDRGNGNLSFWKIGPEVFPHLARHAAVQSAHAIAEISQAQSKDGHAELLIGIAGILPPHSQEFV